MVLREELEGLREKSGGRLEVVYAVGESSGLEDASVKQGRISRSLLEEVMKVQEKDVKVLVCGPRGMESALTGKKGILEELGYAREQVYTF